MNQDVREYLTEVVRVLTVRRKNRGSNGLKKWERKLLAGAQALLTNGTQADIPGVLTPLPANVEGGL